MNSKKGFVKFVLITLGLVATIMLFCTCEIGLGNSVDTQVPVITISTPTVDDTVNKTIKVSGTASDDNKLVKVSVQFRNTDKNSIESVRDAVINPNNNTWELDVDTTSENFGLSDGSYEITATAFDGANKQSSATRSFVIDNTAPTVLVTSPVTYGGNNIVTFASKIEIKGEVYDSTTINSVDVFLVNENGVEQKKVTADGKTSWSALFSADDLSALQDGGRYYFYVVATDKGGNKNTYYFHKADIYPLLDSVNGYITFPSMTQIGQVDQGKTNQTSSGLTADELESIRKDAKSTIVPVVDEYPDFIYQKNPSAAVQWLNIGSGASIGTGVPIVGTILPPSDNSSIKRDSVKIYIQTTAPDSPWIIQNDTTLTSVGESLNFTVTPKIDGSELTEGTYYVKITFQTNSNSEGEASQDFMISEGAPVLTETTIAGKANPPVSGNAMFAQALIAQNCDIQGTAFMSNKTDAFTVGLTYEITKTSDASIVSGTIPVNQNGEWSLPLDVNSLSEDTYTYIIKASADPFVTILTRIVIIDNTSPSLIVSSPVNGSTVSSDGITIAGSATDTTSGVNAAYWCIDNGSVNHEKSELSDVNNITNTIELGKWHLFASPYNLNATPVYTTAELPVGEYKVWVAAVDVGGLISNVVERTIYIDNALPNLVIEAEPATVSVNNYSLITYSGKAFDDSKSLEKLTISVDGETASNLSLSKVTNATSTEPATWSFSAESTLSEGTHTFLFTLYDKAGKTSSIRKSITLDKTGPIINLSNLENGTSISDSSYTIRGTTSDLITNVVSIQYSEDSGTTWQDPTGTLTSWTIPMTGMTVEGSKTIRFKATDSVGNISYIPTDGTSDITYYADKNNPTLTETTVGISGLTTKADFSFAGKVGDTNSLSSLKLSTTVNGNPKEWTATVTQNNIEQDWSYSFVVGSENSGNENYVPDGDYVFTIAATDIANKVTQFDRTVKVDTTNPVISNVEVSCTEEGKVIDGDNWYPSGTLKLTVTATDSGTGLASVDYRSAATILEFTDSLAWQSATKRTSTWEGTVNAIEGVNYIQVRASDVAENKLMYSTNIKVVVDISDPVLTTDNINDSNIIYKNTQQTLTIRASDSSGSVSVSATESKDAGTPNNLTLVSEGTGTWTYVVPFASDSTKDAIYTYVIKATDTYGKVTTITRNIGIDTTAPTIEVISPGVDESVENETFSIRGTVNDGGSGVANLEYVIVKDGVDAPDTGWTEITSFTGSSWSVSGLSLVGGEGTFALFTKATDKLGKTSIPQRVIFYLDKNNPELDEITIGIGGSTTNSGFSFGGTVKDTNALKTLSIATTVNGTPKSFNVAITQDNQQQNWTYAFVVGTGNSSATNYLLDGSYVFTIVAEDIAKRKTQIQRTVIVDTGNPTLTESKISTTGSVVNTVTWYGASSLQISVSASDIFNGIAGNGSGVTKVEYAIISNPVTIPSAIETDWNAASWASMTKGSSSWTSNVQVAPGINYIQMKATDAAGNSTILGTNLIANVDLISPVYENVTVSGLTNNNLLVNKQSAVTAEITASDVGSGVASVKAKIGNQDFSSDAIAATINGSKWNVTIPTTAQKSGTVFVEIADAVGNKTVSNMFTMQVDDTKPEVTFTTARGTVNKVISLAGTASDDQGLSTVVVSYLSDGSYTEVEGSYSFTSEEWTTLTSTGTFNWSVSDLNTVGIYDGSTSIAGTQLLLRAVATDKAGNTKSTYLVLTVDQNADRPVIKLNNINTHANTGLNASYTYPTTLKGVTTVYGSVTDDDGIATFKVSEDGSNWQTANEVGSRLILDGASWTYEPTTGDGTKNLYFSVTDTSGTTFVTGGETDAGSSSQTGKPYVQYKENVQKSATSAITFGIDTIAPEIGSTIYIDYTPATGSSAPDCFNDDYSSDTAKESLSKVTTNLLLGNKAKLSLLIEATDAMGIDSVVVTGTGVNAIAVQNGTSKNWITPIIDIASLADGTNTLTITVTDNSGMVSTATRTVRIDNTAPTVSITYPSATEQVTGIVEMRGSASDDIAGMDYVKWMIPSKTQVSNGVTKDTAGWKDITSGSSTIWNIKFEDANELKNFANSLYATETVVGANIWDVPVYFLVKDKAENTSVITGNTLRVDPDGDKPKVAITYPLGEAKSTSITAGGVSTNNYITLGGAIRIFGTASDNEVVNSVWLQIDADNDGDYDNDDYDYIITKTSGSYLYSEGTWNGTGDFPTTATIVKFTNVDTTQNWWGIKASGTVSWNTTINTLGEYNPTGSDSTRVIKYRVRSRDDDGDISLWSDSVVIQIDKNSPQIGAGTGLKLVQRTEDLATGSVIAEQDYVSGVYLKGIWFLTGSITDDSGLKGISTTTTYGSANTVTSGDQSITDGTVTSSWFTKVSAGEYTMNIPVSINSTNGAVKFTIEAKDDSDPANNSSVSIVLNCDNTAPTQTLVQNGVGGGVLNATTTKIIQSNDTFALSSTVTENGSGFGRVAFYLLRDVDGEANDRLYNPMEDRTDNANRTYINTPTDNLVMKDGLYAKALTGTRTGEGTFTNVDISTNKNIRVGGLIHIGGMYRKISAVDRTNGIVTFSPSVDKSYTDAWFAYAMIVDNFTTESLQNGIIDNDDGDGMVESVKDTASGFVWTAYINSKNIPDGPINVVTVAYDAAGNFASNSTDTQVENNGPKLAKVTLGTDLDGSGAITSTEKIEYSTLNGEGDKVVSATVTADGNVAGIEKFTAKGITSILPEIVGGNGEIKYTLKVGNGSIETGHDLVAIRSSENGTVSEINLALDGSGKLLGKDDGTYTYNLTFWDSTEETTCGTNSQSATAAVTFVVDAVDEVAPKAVIDPFYWTSTTENSLYDNSKDNGHIELEADLPSVTFNGTTGIFDTDPKVSGKISVRGSAYDDQRLTAIYMSIDGFAFTGNTGNKTFNSTTYYKVASFDSGTGTWTANDQWATNGWKFTITPDYLNQSGHHVTWQLDWDSSKVTGIAKADVKIQVLAEDRTPNASATSNSGTSDDGHAIYNKPLYRVDVVPYISKVSTPNRTNSGLKNNNIRSSSGKYSIIKGTTGNFISVEGFNLNPNAVRIYDSTEVEASSSTTSTGTGVTYSTGSTPYSSITISNNISVSGYLEVFTNGIRTLNNINTNTVDSNKEEDLYILKNKLLNDDRYLRVFDMKDTGVKNGYYPEMILDGNDPVFGYIDLNGKNSSVAEATLTNPYVSSNYMPQRAKFSSTTGKTSDIEYLVGGLTWSQMAMVKDEAGKYIQSMVYDYDGARITVIYDKYAEQHTWSGYTDGWGPGTGWSGYNGNWAYNTGNNAIALESTGYTPGTLIGRYQNLKLIAKGNSSTTTGASVYMAYYDDNTANKDLIFRAFKIGQTSSWANTLKDGYSNLAENNTNGRKVVASSASKDFAFGVTSTNIIVFAYYDMADARLKLKYSSVAVDGSNVTQSITWKESSVVLPNYIGNYVSMSIDKNDRLHIAAYDASESNLAYIYLDSYSATTYKQVTIDQAFSVGNWTQIKLKETDLGAIPYIAYYNSTETGSRDSIKLAYSKNIVVSNETALGGVDDSSFTTGNWEYMTIPSITAAQGGDSKFKQVNLDFDSSGKPVIGYLGTNLEFGKWLDE